MARNVEIKAQARDPERQVALAAELAGSQAATLRQRDVFFKVSEGRLKLRLESVNNGPETGTLIAYRRPDQAGPKTSDYRLVAIADPSALEEALRLAPGVIGEVKKERQLLLVGRTRIHLDRVEDLGAFIELEVVLHPHQTEAEGQAEAKRLMQALEIKEADLIEGAYLDMLIGQSR